MKTNQVFDYYDTLIIYQQNFDHLLWNDKWFLTQKQFAFVAESNTNLKTIFQKKLIKMQHQVVQHSVSQNLFKKLSSLKKNICNQQQLKIFFNQLIQQSQLNHVSLNSFHKIDILNKHQIYIEQINKKIYFGKIVYLKFSQCQQKRKLKKQEQLKNIAFFDFQQLYSLVQRKDKQILLKFNTVQQVMWISIIFFNLDLIAGQNRKICINQESQIINNHRLLFQQLQNKFCLQIVSKVHSQSINICINCETMMPIYCKQYTIADFQNKNFIQKCDYTYKRQISIVQPILNYYYFYLYEFDKNRNQQQYTLKQCKYKYPIIGSVQEQNCIIVFKINQNQQVIGFSGLGKSLKYLSNTFKIFVRKKYMLNQILDMINQELTFDDIIQTYEVCSDFQYPKL